MALSCIARNKMTLRQWSTLTSASCVTSATYSFALGWCTVLAAASVPCQLCVPPCYGLRSSYSSFSLFRVILEVVVLELDKLVKAKLAQGHALARVLPACPREVLLFVTQTQQRSAYHIMIPGSAIRQQQPLPRQKRDTLHFPNRPSRRRRDEWVCTYRAGVIRAVDKHCTSLDQLG